MLELIPKDVNCQHGCCYLKYKALLTSCLRRHATRNKQVNLQCSDLQSLLVNTCVGLFILGFMLTKRMLSFSPARWFAWKTAFDPASTISSLCSFEKVGPRLRNPAPAGSDPKDRARSAMLNSWSFSWVFCLFSMSSSISNSLLLYP